MTRRIVLWGAGWHAATIVDILRLRGEHEVVGLLDDVNPERVGTTFRGLPILGGAERLESLRADGVDEMILAMGDCRARLRLASIVQDRGFTLATAIHPSAVIGEGVPIGAGTVIKAGVIVDVGATIGENVLLSAGVLIGHASILADGSRVASGAVLAGSVTVGEGTMIGIGACVVERIRIGRHSMIGAGAVVVRDVPDGVVAYGVPARIERRLTP